MQNLKEESRLRPHRQRWMRFGRLGRPRHLAGVRTGTERGRKRTRDFGTPARVPCAALCFVVLLVMLMPVVWAPAAHAQDRGVVPGFDDNTVGDGVTGEDTSGTTGGDTASESDEGSGLVGGIAEDVFNTIMNNIVEKTADAAAGWSEDFLTEGAFSLPEPEGDIKSFYDQVSAVVQPGAIALLLLTGLMLTLRGANYNTSYATQNALPKIVFFFAALAFFPEVMGMISDVTRNLADALVDPSQLSDAYVRLLEAQAKTGGLLGGAIVLAAAALVLFLFVISIFKSFLFGVLFIAGPLAMFVYPIPTLSGLTSQWFKATIACTAIPLLWAIEASIGSALISAPEMMFGEGYSNNFIVPVLVLVLSWVMIKTPFKVFEWCFYGYSAGGGLASHVARAGATRLAIGAFGR